MAIPVVMLVMVVAGECHAMHLMMVLWRDLPHVRGKVFARFRMCGNTFHRDSRERLNREAQREQHDDEEFAPVRHGSGV
ncbi:hypothetical protein NUV26_13610 [Burkholderia pseudomultivorans]|uniref:hypothetical protein n=1 Tax=Burkholderia cepacia complex TaxID=87882 RepID=UPI0015E37433|nr:MULTISPECIES: hypothetical protein [Burkholderia cepacia complex]MBR8142737.1 hypothetical protein [Burkholderia vietnamiensis]MBU9565008.1 hypothetical protein [Burkholderia multivorans]MCO8623740.1 hypothetical protein [Burkholderia multivorans]MDN8002821.1 hypothetical protein [Burkholderia multivorans]MDS0793196.1 hypothetical protein [Burkholderia pseudomultivorans]